MKNWLRELLMPLAVITIVATVWSLAWSSEISAKAAKAVRESGAKIQITNRDDGYPTVRLSDRSDTDHAGETVVAVNGQ